MREYMTSRLYDETTLAKIFVCESFKIYFVCKNKHPVFIIKY